MKPDFEDKLKNLPLGPGVYLMRDDKDAIIYVGKAKSLRSRVRSYFRRDQEGRSGRGPQIDKMISLISRFEVIITDSELEALVLENNLIKEYSPRYNTLLKDDKTYPYIKVTLGEEYPRVLFSREMKKDRSRYFGPYASAYAVRESIELINKLYQLRSCNRSLPREIGSGRACLNYHIKQCSAPCQNYATKEDYASRIRLAIDFLNGSYAQTLKDLQKKMTEASENTDYEEAIRYRDLYQSVEKVALRQKITDIDGEDKDILALATAEDESVVQVFFIREGKLIGREHFYMTHTAETAPSQIMLDFIKQFYGGTPFIPRELVLPEEIDDIEILEQWLSKKRGSRVYIKIPQIGAKEKMVELATKNASLILSQDKERIKREEGRTIGAVKEIASLLDLPAINRLEAFDISNISGFANVGSMVVYEKGKPKLSDYRKFKIKTVSGPDDYACMKEVLKRRLSHGTLEQARLDEKGLEKEFGSFTKFPDLILMDGGKGQVNIALQVLAELKIDIPVCGMVKDENHRTRGLFYQNEEIKINKNSEGFKLLTRIQEEAHRFAIEFHRSLRGKAQVKSVLDEIPGIGPARRKALMRYFKSIDEIKAASIETLSALPEIPESAAKVIYRFFRAGEIEES
ncbi:MAG: excinuclease ABC subunit UvrC [Lachnospiraceae bacterium]|nr:excinuclease ABC subunit UvrC [Lachnospiraceae bacterium]